MSANNWRMCPKCMFLDSEKLYKAQKALEEQYGVMPASEYAKELKKLADIPIEPSRDTLREDWEIGLREYSSRRFLVNYSCFCTKCGFTWQFKHEEVIDVKQSKKVL